MELLSNVLDVIANLATIIPVFITLVVWYKKKKK